MEHSRSRQGLLAGAAVAFGGACLVASAADPAESGLSRIITGTWIVELLLLSLALTGAWATGRPPARALGWRPGRLSVGTVGVLALGTLAASHALDGILTLLDLRGESTLGILGEALEGIRGVDLAAALVTLGILPAIAEELLCRGLVQRALLRRLAPALAIAWSSALFAGLHGEPIHALLAAPLGVHLGVIAWWSRSLWPAIACHAINNLGAVLLGAVAVELPGPAALHVALGLALTTAGWAVALGLERRRGRHPRGGISLQPTPGLDDR